MTAPIQRSTFNTDEALLLINRINTNGAHSSNAKYVGEIEKICLYENSIGISAIAIAQTNCIPYFTVILLFTRICNLFTLLSAHHPFCAFLLLNHRANLCILLYVPTHPRCRRNFFSLADADNCSYFTS